MQFHRRRWRCICKQELSRLLQRIATFAPVANSAVHGNDVGIPHFLQVIGGQRGAEAAATIEDEFGLQIGILGLNIALNDTLTQVNGSGQVVAQTPDPGAEIEPGNTCVLTLGRESRP